MFGLFKKKEPAKAVETAYHCIGVRYDQEISIDGENLDKLKEELFVKLKDKVYTRTEIDTITEKIGYDIWKSFGWFEATRKGNPAPEVKRSVDLKYRFLGYKDGLVFPETQEKANKHLTIGMFYKRTEIENASMRAGVSLWDRCDWEQYRIHKLSIPSKGIEVEYQEKDPKTKAK
ncbi:hypothetical protein [Flaviaesturariibacter amylovorans]|uniref:Bacterial HORMA domain-containing protein n=1 Tax=Flaviaesturariibacter amylovorans TaxID=1084520 RepID=A0ABP8GL37_9BACT